MSRPPEAREPNHDPLDFSGGEYSGQATAISEGWTCIQGHNHAVAGEAVACTRAWNRAHEGEGLPLARHEPRRGDDVEAWLKRWRDDCEYEWERGIRNRIDAMLDDYRLRADTGTPLDGEVPER